MQYVQYLIIIVILVIIALSITKTKKKDYKIEVNKLVDYLGGKNNIIDYEFNKSRFVVKLENVELVNKEAIQKMGAQGIVEIDNQLKIILGPDAKQIKKYINDLEWKFSLFFFFRQNTTNENGILLSKGEVLWGLLKLLH